MNVSGEPLERNEVHFLKILPQYFKEVLAGKKTFELRKDDRNYKVNDAIILREFDGGNYTGRKLFTYITYILLLFFERHSQLSEQCSCFFVSFCCCND